MKELTLKRLPTNPSNSIYELKFSEGLAPYHENGLWGFIDTIGNIIIPAKYLNVGTFSEGLVSVASKINGQIKQGFIDKNENPIIDFVFDPLYFLPYFKNGIAIVWRLNERQWRYIDKSGNLIPDLSDFNPKKLFSKQGVAVAYQNGIEYIIGKTKRPLIRNKWPEIDTENYDHNTGIYLSQKSIVNNWYLEFNQVDIKNRKVINPFENEMPNRFKQANQFNSGIATGMKLSETVFIFDKKGHRVGSKINWAYCGAYNDDYISVASHIKHKNIANFYNPLKDSYLFQNHQSNIDNYMGDFHCRISKVSKGRKQGGVGYMDNLGQLIIPRKYNQGSNFKENMACVELNKEFIYIDKNGKEVFKFK
jgi:hypothetical protein